MVVSGNGSLTAAAGEGVTGSADRTFDAVTSIHRAPLSRSRVTCTESPSAKMWMWQGASAGPGADVGRGEPGPGADVARVSPVPAQMWPTSWSQSATHSAACDGLRCALSVACRTESHSRKGTAGAALRTAPERDDEPLVSEGRVLHGKWHRALQDADAVLTRC